MKPIPALEKIQELNKELIGVMEEAIRKQDKYSDFGREYFDSSKVSKLLNQIDDQCFFAIKEGKQNETDNKR